MSGSGRRGPVAFVSANLWMRAGVDVTLRQRCDLDFLGSFDPEEFVELGVAGLPAATVLVEVGHAQGWDRYRDGECVAVVRESAAGHRSDSRSLRIVAVVASNLHPVAKLRLDEVGFDAWCHRDDLPDPEAVVTSLCAPHSLVSLKPDDLVLRSFGLTPRSRPHELLRAVEREGLIEEFARWDSGQETLSRRSRITYRTRLAEVGRVVPGLARFAGGPTEAKLPTWKELRMVIDLARGARLD